MPRAGDDAIPYLAEPEGPALVRTTVLDGVKFSAVGNDGELLSIERDELGALGGHLGGWANPHKLIHDLPALPRSFFHCAVVPRIETVSLRVNEAAVCALAPLGVGVELPHRIEL